MAFDKTKSPGFLANHLARLFARHLQAAIAPLGLAPAQFMALLELWEEEGLTQAELVERLDVEQATLANTLKRMERDGLVRREPHPTDSRAQLIRLTAKGRALEAQAKEAAQGVNQTALSDFTRAERAAFITLANQMIARLRRS